MFHSNLSGLNGVMSMSVEFCNISSEMTLPIAGPKVIQDLNAPVPTYICG